MRFDELHGLSLAYASRFFRDQATGSAHDAAQETLTRLWERWAKLRDHPNLEGWTLVTTRMVCLEMVRGRSVSGPSRTVDVPGVEPEVLSQAFVEALSSLSDRQRRVVVARYYYGYSVRETGELLDLTDSKVKDATHEAVSHLRRHPTLVELREP